MLPAGEIEFAGHDAGTNGGGSMLVKPSTVKLEAKTAACVLFVSFAAITIDTRMTSSET